MNGMRRVTIRVICDGLDMPLFVILLKSIDFAIFFKYNGLCYVAVKKLHFLILS